jgi:hypothetical protein
VSRRICWPGVEANALGTLATGVGLYFIFLRPPLLPETFSTPASIPTALPPAFLDWLGIVFATRESKFFDHADPEMVRRLSARTIS